MRQPIEGSHHTDSFGNPQGGVTTGRGIDVVWQTGPLGRGDNRSAPNGAFVEGVIAAAADRLRYYQRTKFQCAENAEALEHLDLALKALDRRTKDREARDVEGTHAT